MGGAGVLPQICADYPRSFNRVGRRLEVSSSLSCPELARLCLLADDAMEPSDIDPAPAAESPLKHRIVDGERDPYRAYFDDIQHTLSSLLALPGFPLRSRLFFAFNLARLLGPFFHEGCNSIDEDHLLAQLAMSVSPVSHAAWHAQLQAMTPSRAAAERLVLDLLAPCANDSGKSTFRVLIDELLVGAFTARRDAWEAVCGDRIDRYFSHYCRNHCARDPYIGSPDVLVHLQRLLLRVALLRFTLFSHPRLGLPTGSVTERNAGLDAAVVEVVYKFGRGFEHAAASVQHLEDVGASVRVFDLVVPLLTL